VMREAMRVNRPMLGWCGGWSRHPTRVCCAVFAHGLRVGAETGFGSIWGRGTAQFVRRNSGKTRQLPRFGAVFGAQPDVGLRVDVACGACAKPTFWKMKTWEIRARFFRAGVGRGVLGVARRGRGAPLFDGDRNMVRGWRARATRRDHGGDTPSGVRRTGSQACPRGGPSRTRGGQNPARAAIR
jgi:hypothetical protein